MFSLKTQLVLKTPERFEVGLLFVCFSFFVKGEAWFWLIFLLILFGQFASSAHDFDRN